MGSVAVEGILPMLQLKPLQKLSEWKPRDILGGPVVKTPCYHCKGHKFDPLLGNQDPAWKKKIIKKERWEAILFRAENKEDKEEH